MRHTPLLLVLLLLATLSVANAQTPPIRWSRAGYSDAVSAIAVSPDRSTIAVASIISNSISLYRPDGTLITRDLTYKPDEEYAYFPYALAWSPDGKELAAISGPDIVLWDAKHQTIHKTLKNGGAASYTASIAYSSSGRYLVASAWSNGLWCYDLLGDSLITGLNHPDFFRVVAAGPNDRVAAVDEHGELAEWDLTSRQLMRSFTVDSMIGATKLSLTISPNGRYALVGLSGGARVALFDLESRRMISTREVTFASGITFQFATAFSADGTRAIYGTDGGVIVLDVESGTVAQFLSTRAAQGNFVTFGAGDSTIIVGDLYRTLEVVNAEDGAHRHTILGNDGRVRDLTLSPDGTHLASTALQGALRVWDAATGELLWNSNRTHAIGMRPTSRPLFLNGGSEVLAVLVDGSLTFFNAEDGTPTGSIPLDLSEPQSGGDDLGRALAVSPDERTIAVGSRSGDIIIIRDRDIKHHLHVGFAVNSLAFSPDGSRLAGAGMGRIILDPATGVTVASQDYGYESFIRYWPDGTKLIGNDMGTEDTLLQSNPEVFNNHSDFVTNLIYSRRGDLFVTSGADSMIYIVDTVSTWPNRVISSFHTHAIPLSVALSPDNRTLYVGFDVADLVAYDLGTALASVRGEAVSRSDLAVRAIGDHRLAVISAHEGRGTLEVYDARGERVMGINDVRWREGETEIELPGGSLASGLYRCLLRGDGIAVSTPLLLTR